MIGYDIFYFTIIFFEYIHFIICIGFLSLIFYIYHKLTVSESNVSKSSVLFISIMIPLYMVVAYLNYIVYNENIRELKFLTDIGAVFEIPAVFLLLDKIWFKSDDDKEKQIQQYLSEIQEELKTLSNKNKSIDESLDTIKNELIDTRDNTSKKSFKQMFLSFIKK